MAEIGVILLMFGVGMHFHPQELLRVWRIAVPGAIAQSVVATVAGWASRALFGWSNAAGFVFGMALAVASTVVLMRMLVDQDRLAHARRATSPSAGSSSRTSSPWSRWSCCRRSPPSAAIAAGARRARSALALGKAAVFAALVWVGGQPRSSRR